MQHLKLMSQTPALRSQRWAASEAYINYFGSCFLIWIMGKIVVAAHRLVRYRLRWEKCKLSWYRCWLSLLENTSLFAMQLKMFWFVLCAWVLVCAFLKNIITLKNFLCVCRCVPAFHYVHHVLAVPTGTRRGHWVCGTRVTGVWEPLRVGAGS